MTRAEPMPCGDPHALWNPLNIDWSTSFAALVALLVYGFPGVMVGGFFGTAYGEITEWYTEARRDHRIRTLPSRRCASLRLDGQYCRSWAVKSDDLGRCPYHLMRDAAVEPNSKGETYRPMEEYWRRL